MARPNSNLWRSRRSEILDHVIQLFFISLIYILGESNVIAVSVALVPAQLQYFASILGMVLVFVTMTAFGSAFRRCDDFYYQWIKARVDFINANLGVGFTVPIIMLKHVLGIRDIGYIAATSVVTNITSWVAVFLLSLSGLSLIRKIRHRGSEDAQCSPPIVVVAGSSSLEAQENACLATLGPFERQWQHSAAAMADDQSSSSKEDFADDQPINAPTPERPDKSLWYFLKTNGYPLFCLVGIVSVGVPLEVKFRDSRAMDGFALWMCWIISVRLQRMMKSAYFLTANMRYRHTLSTMINPVLATTMLMLGYTRLRGAIQQFEGGISKVLGGFSSGTPLYSIWAALVMPSTMPDNPSRWFGAGDFALSLLECGIVTWGFKLYECRRQLFSHAGVCIALFSSIAAAGNVFLSVLLAGILGLEAPEALSFAARSTTLALAKPAVKTLGGNLALNATLVVSNGILGQLLYPFLLDKLNVPVSSQDGPDTDKQKDGKDDGDSCTTVAAGAAIGINGAAMGVSYLYEVKSRAAPYAALSMTLFGVMTVVFTTLEPFKGLVLRLAARLHDAEPTRVTYNGFASI